MKDKFIEDMPCAKFRKELRSFIESKWTSANNSTVQLITEDVIMFFDKYHRENGCFFDGK